MRRLIGWFVALGVLVALAAGAISLGGCDQFWPLTAVIRLPQGTSGHAPFSVQFEDVSVGWIASRAWDFGDPASGTSNTSTLDSPTHVYWEDGIYSATLVVYDTEGRWSRATVLITVQNPPPVAVLGVAPDHGPAPLDVRFDLSPSYDPAGIVPTPSGSIVFYSLDFGDGSPPMTGMDLAASIDHTYATPGHRSATLTVIDNDGAAATATRGITVEGGVASIPSPGPDPAGLAYDGSSLWVSDATQRRIYKVRPLDGSIVAEFDAPGGPAPSAASKGIVPGPGPAGTPAGLAWHDGALWVACVSDGKLYKVNPQLSPGDPAHVIAVIESTDFAPYGLAYGGGALWVSDVSRGRILKIDPWTADVLASLPAPGAASAGPAARGIVPVAPTGVAWADGSLWVTAGPTLYRLSPTNGATLGTTPAPGATPAGLAFDGLYLWVCDPDGVNPGRIDRLVVP